MYRGKNISIIPQEDVTYVAQGEYGRNKLNRQSLLQKKNKKNRIVLIRYQNGGS
jgi:hypothetical protein